MDDTDNMDDTAANTSRFVAYDGDVDALKDENAILFFHSKTCGSCKTLSDDITENANDIPEDVMVYKVDWDENQDLAKEYGIAKYHTLRYVGSEENVTGIFTLEEVLAKL